MERFYEDGIVECTGYFDSLYLEECAQEVWERNRMSPDMHTTWWNVKIRKLMEMILMVFREQSEEDDQ